MGIERTQFTLKCGTSSISCTLGTVDFMDGEEMPSEVTFVRKVMIAQGARKLGILSAFELQVSPQGGLVLVSLLALFALETFLLNLSDYNIIYIKR